jgi:hypothetical protein
MDGVNVNEKLVCGDNALVRQTSVDLINQCHCATVQSDSTPNDGENFDEDVDGSDDDEASELMHGDITLAEEEEEVRIVPD